MLYLVKGRAGSGKSDFINEKIKTILDDSNSSVLLIVPEQFSFESERKLLRYLGEEKYNRTDIFSFPRLSYSVLNDSFDYTNIPSQGVRLALMHEAIVALEGRLNIFGKTRPTVNSLRPLINLSSELKHCSVNSNKLSDITAQLNDGYLKDKLNEFSLINETYDALVKQSFADDTEALDAFNEYAIDNKFFANKTIFIDSFRAFTEQEAHIFETMLSQCDDIYVTLCADATYKKDSAFSYIKKFETQLCTIASKSNRNIQVDHSIYLEQKDISFSKDISALERSLFSDEMIECTESDNSVKIVRCDTSDDECDYISREIKRLLRSGEYRCRDIAVIERSAGTYKNRIINKLRKLDIPVFDDNRRSLKYEPIFVYLDSVLKCISNGFTQESVFAYLKSGLSGVSIEDVSRLEKYVIVWNITGKKWSEPFTLHPRGYGNEFEDYDNANLEIINKVRERAVAPVLALKKRCKDKTGAEITATIYDFLVEQKIPDRLYDLFSELNETGFSVEANRQSVSWDLMISILDSMARLYSDRFVSVKDWANKFSLLVESGDVGEIPQGLDEVKIGSADRIRTDKLKVVFLVGVNKNEFPLVSIKNGILTDADRVSLKRIGLDINPPFEETIDEERFISYCAVTAASERLYLVYKSTADDGSTATESEIITEATKCIRGVSLIDAQKLPVIDSIESKDDAFHVMASSYSSNKVIKNTLMKYLENNSEYVDRLRALNRAVGKVDFAIEDSGLSLNLFKKDINVSPSSMECYNNCPFSYFMKHGIKAKDIEAAKLDPRVSGNIIHYILEHVINDYVDDWAESEKKGIKSTQRLIDATESELRESVSKYLTIYYDELMGNISEQSKRFMYLYNRVVELCMVVLERLRNEFDVGAFVPVDYELEIGDPNHGKHKVDNPEENSTKFKAYSLKLDNGSISVNGKIDRVDMMVKDDLRYIRVIDYKSGKKEFRLSQLLSGYNLQMVLYLMAIMRDGNKRYGDNLLPAAVLYLPSKIGIDKFMSVRNPSHDNVLDTKRTSGKLMGMALKSPVVYTGMGANKHSDYLPVSYDKDNNLIGNYYTQANFNALSKIIDDKIIGMGNDLHNGKICASPLSASGKPIPCSFCDYKAVCGFENDFETRDILNVSHKEAIKMLGGEELGD